MNHKKEVDVFIGSRLELLRIERDQTQRDVAEVLGVSFQQVQKYEAGINRISAGYIQILCAFYKIPPSYFYDTSFLGDLDKTNELSDKIRTIVDPQTKRMVLEMLDCAVRFQGKARF